MFKDNYIIDSSGNHLVELTAEEYQIVSGGGVWEAAVAMGVAVGGAFVAGWNAGRTFVRDVRRKFF